MLEVDVFEPQDSDDASFLVSIKTPSCELRPCHLIFVSDVSGSMKSPMGDVSRIDAVRSVITALSATVHQDSTFTSVTFGNSGKVLATDSNTPVLPIVTDEGTNLEAGLEAAAQSVLGLCFSGPSSAPPPHIPMPRMLRTDSGTAGTDDDSIETNLSSLLLSANQTSCTSSTSPASSKPPEHDDEDAKQHQCRRTVLCIFTDGHINAGSTSKSRLAAIIRTFSAITWIVGISPDSDFTMLESLSGMCSNCTFTQVNTLGEIADAAGRFSVVASTSTLGTIEHSIDGTEYDPMVDFCLPRNATGVYRVCSPLVKGRVCFNSYNNPSFHEMRSAQTIDFKSPGSRNELAFEAMRLLEKARHSMLVPFDIANKHREIDEAKTRIETEVKVKGKYNPAVESLLAQINVSLQIMVTIDEKSMPITLVRARSTSERSCSQSQECEEEGRRFTTTRLAVHYLDPTYMYSDIDSLAAPPLLYVQHEDGWHLAGASEQSRGIKFSQQWIRYVPTDPSQDVVLI